MAGESRAKLRDIVRALMRDLETSSLGTFSPGHLRDTFRLRLELAVCGRLATRSAQRNFIRSEDRGLLFRDAAPAFIEWIGPSTLALSKADSRKGIEFPWSGLSPETIRHLFASVTYLARQGVSGSKGGPDEPLEALCRVDVQPQPPTTTSLATGERRRGKALAFDFIPNGVDQSKALIYAWEIRDDSGTLRYRYVGQSRLGSKRPLNRYDQNVANLLAERPYWPSKPDGFRTPHKRLADATKRGWPIVLRLLTNVSQPEQILAVEACYQRKMDLDDWPADGRQ